MRQILFVISTIFLGFFLNSCSDSKEQEIVELRGDEIITMEVLDDYLFRDDVQYVDLRNHEQLYASGYIYSFENIPFFDYLDFRAFDRNGSYEFDVDQIINEVQLTRFFDPEKAIFLMADGCVRSGYIKDALNFLGYEKVYVIGGFYEYDGAYKVLGDGAYDVGGSFYEYYTDSTTNITYHIYGKYDIDRHPTSLRIDMIDESGVSLRSQNYDEFIDYNEQLSILESAILSYGTNFNNLYEYLTDPNDTSHRNIEGYTLGFDQGFLELVRKLTASYR